MALTAIPTTGVPLLTRPWAVAASTYLRVLNPEDSEGIYRWLSGWEFAPFGCARIAGLAVEDPCDSTPTERTTNLEWPGDPEEDEDESEGCVEFQPFEVFVRIEDQLTTGPGPLEVSTFLAAQSELAISYILAREVYNGLLGGTSESLVDDATIVTGLDQTAVGALAAVENGLAARLANGRGMIHVTPGMLSVLYAGGGLVFADNQFFTPTGNLVVADAGFPGGEPAAHTGTAGAVTSGEEWIYGSSDVHWAITEGRIYPDLTLNRNKQTSAFSAMAVVKFEPCSVVAALATTS